MFQVATWWLTIEGLGLLGWAAGRRAFARLPDRGFVFAKSLGILLVGGTHWLLTTAGILRNDVGGVLLSILVVGVLAVRPLLAERGSSPARPLHLGFARQPLRLLVVSETIFAAAFFGWTAVRYADPAVTHTEQPMDLMFLTALSEQIGPIPGDPWLAGEPVSYYYFGYWLVSLIGRLAATPPEVTYNLGQATWWALLATGAFGLAFHATRSWIGRGSSRRSLAAGGLAAVATAFAGNLHLVSELVRRRASGDALFGEWWWWRSSRVVVDQDLAGAPVEVITEFPFFSYLLGDNHPHLLSMPFLLLVGALSFALARDARAAVRPFDGQRRAACALAVFASALLVPLNTWDFPAAFAMTSLGICLAHARSGGPAPRVRALRALAAASLAALAAALVALPFLLTAQSQVQGLRPNLLHPTRPGQALLMFGLFLPGVLLVAIPPGVAAWRRESRLTAAAFAGLVFAEFGALACGALWTLRSDTGRAWAAAAGGGEAMRTALLERWTSDGWTLAAILVLVAALLAKLIAGKWTRRSGGAEWLVGTTVIALGLVAAPELVYLQDLFGTRMNTVFKAWYQAWPLLALASAAGLASARRRRRGAAVLAAAGTALLALALVYPALALPSKIAPRAGTLDALAHLDGFAPGLRRAALWLRDSAPRDARILEAPGDSYHADQNLFSMATGRATLLGWRGHEEQWRGAAYSRLSAGREPAAAAVYAARDIRSLTEALEHWQIEFVVYGPRERELYGAADPGTETRLRALMDPAFDSAEVTIFRRRR